MAFLYSSTEAGAAPIVPVNYQSSLRVGIDVDWAKTPRGRAAAQRSHKAGIPFAINSDTKYFDREHNIWYPSRKKLLDTILKRYQ